MYKKTLLSLFLGILFFATYSQEYRTLDGTNNNPIHPEWGSAFSEKPRLTSIGYSDGISTPGGLTRPNPRAISNALFAQDGPLFDPLGLSDFCWVFGQFIDHDITKVLDGSEFSFIPVPTGDTWFDPFSTGQVLIPMKRSGAIQGTGTSMANPRQHPNAITSFIDASSVYGSGEERAHYLRSFEDGKLRMSAGNLLPFNTDSGEYDGSIDHDAPEMDNPVGLTDKYFVAGDSRANENPLLTSFHTLFAREHNRVCDELKAKHPDWNGEQLYQHARRIVGGLVQALVYEEWLGEMGIFLPEYTGYKPDVDPGIFNVFSAAAYRLGHTLLSGKIMLMDNGGDEMGEEELFLKDAYFNPMLVVENGGIDVFLKGMGAQMQQNCDAKVVDDVRNFLFGPPGAGGLDLASININRGRERGIPHFNKLRQDIGLEAYETFDQIVPNPETYTVLENLYGDINDVDAWVGMLAEEHMPGALFGETIMKIMEIQFAALRDGDRFFYWNDPNLSNREKARIRDTRLHDIIMRNSDVTLMQDRVFEAMPHEDICPPVTYSGTISTQFGDPVSEVSVNMVDINTNTYSMSTEDDGAFAFADVMKCEQEFLMLEKEGNIANGVSTLDLLLLAKHILGITPIESPYTLIAADANHSNSISTFDMVVMRKAILNMIQFFPNNTSWRFVSADYEFADPNAPFEFPEIINLEDGIQGITQNFVAIKTADLNNSVNPNQFENADDRNLTATLVFEAQDQLIDAGESYTLDITSRMMDEVLGYQFTLNYSDALELVKWTPVNLEGLGQNNVAVFPEKGAITTSWNGETNANENDVLFNITFRANEPVRLSEALRLNSTLTTAEAYDHNLDIMDVSLVFTSSEPDMISGLELYQNQPNPFTESTTIAFWMPETENASLSVFDASGKVIKVVDETFDQGYNEWMFKEKDLPGGVLYYRLETSDASLTKKMVMLK